MASDHIAIASKWNFRFLKPKIIRFKNWWIKEAEIDNIVSENWQKIRGCHNIAAKWVESLRNLRLTQYVLLRES